MLAQFGVGFRHGRLPELTRNHVIVPGIGLVRRKGCWRLWSFRFGNGGRGNIVSLRIAARSAWSALGSDSSDSLIEDFAVQFAEGTLQCVHLAFAVALRTAGFGTRVLAGASGCSAGFVSDLVADFPAAVRPAGFSPFVATRGRFRAILAATLFRTLAGWGPDAGIAGIAIAGGL